MAGAWSTFLNTGAGNTILGALGGIGSFAGNLMTSAINSSRSWKYTQKAMALQDMYNRAYTRDQYSLMRTGLKKAGYNPLLALGSSANSAIYSGSGVNSDSDNGSQALESAMAMQNFRYQNNLLKEQVEGQKKDNRVKDLNIEKLEADVRTNPKKLLTEFADTGEVPQVIKKVISNSKNLGSDLVNGLSNPPSSAQTVETRKKQAKNLVHNAINGNKKAQFLLNSMISSPQYRAMLVGYFGYNYVKNLYYRFHSQVGHDKGYDFEYIKDKDLK